MKSKFTVRDLASAWGIHERSVLRILASEKIPYVVQDRKRIFDSKDFTPVIQKNFLKSFPICSSITTASPTQGILLQSGTDVSTIDVGSRGLSEDLLKDPRVQHCAKIVREAQEVPPGWKSRKWVEHVAAKYNHAPKTVYEFIAREKSGGLAAHRHTKKNKGEPKAWDRVALEFGIGLALKRPHRKMSEKAIFEAVAAEARQQGWKIGGYRSFCSHLDKGLNPLLVAIRDSGRRGLDNLLPPILRNYSDLAPFEILVGDQHRFDFWVQDDETGRPFRPEGYFFQDLRTRLVYGLWVGRRYNGRAIGSALRFGCRGFGAFKSIYTDNGKPEVSAYLTSVVDELSALGMSVGEAVDFPLDIENQNPEEIAGVAVINHRKAIVKNAKAKMIESFNHHFEALLRDKFKVPGNVKRLSASGEEQEVDELESKKLAQAGKLLKFSEFLLTVVKAAAFYNRERPHRGVLNEWIWKPRPAQATPIQCLMACYEDGWRPVHVSEDALDLLFLFRETRTVDRGRVHFTTALAKLYEHPALAALHGREVSLRFDPLDPGWILVYADSEFVCRAVPVEYSSMKDRGLATRKIQEKARLGKLYQNEYQRLTSPTPDLTQYSTLPKLETAAKVVRQQIEAERIETEAASVEPSAEQIENAIRENEAFERNLMQGDVLEIERPGTKGRTFEFEIDRYEFLMGEIQRGAELSDSDLQFIAELRAKMDKDTRDYWKCFEEIHGITESVSMTLQRVAN